MTTPNDSTPVKKKKKKHTHHNRHRDSSSSDTDSSEDPPSLTFKTYQNYQQKNNLLLKPSILSPRRSDRLLQKHLLGVGQQHHQQEEIGASSCHLFGVGATAEPSSDYGTGSEVPTTTTTYDPTQSILSDEVSLLSIEDLTPLQALPPTKVTLTITDDSIYLLTPQTHQNNKNYNFRRHRSPSLTAQLLKPDETFVKNTLQLFTTVQKVRITSINYDYVLKPLVSVPFPTTTPDWIYIYHVQSTNTLKLITKTKPKNSHTTFFVSKPGDYYLVPRTNPQTIRRQLLPDHPLTLTHESVTVTFPPCATDYALHTQLQIHNDNYIEYDFGVENTTPAAGVFVLGPNSVSFKLPVVVDVEIVDYAAIIKRFDVVLKVFQCGGEYKKEINHQLIEGTQKIRFTVTGFSFFRIVWTTLTSTLSSANLGLSRLLNRTTNTWMKCQATMDEYENDRFGLEVCVYKSDRRFPEVRAYSHVVGKTQSKFVRHGVIAVNLKSGLFEANLEAGEEVGLRKSEEFWGQDFSVQFSLRFKGPIERGPFGKVLLKHSDNQIVFEFNIQKQGNEGENNEVKEELEDSPSRWSLIALQELATNLFITDGDNWKNLAKHLKFTKHEIKTKFKGQPDPFRAIIDCYQARGGTPEEFIKCLYEVHREIKFSNDDMTGSPTDSISSRRSNRSNKSSGLGSSVHYRNKKKKIVSSSSSSSSSCCSGGGGVRETRESVASGSSQATATTNDSSLHLLTTTSKKSSKKRPSNKTKRKKNKKRRKYSTEQSESSSSDADDKISKHNSSKNSEYLKTSPTPLSPQSPTPLWDFSQHLTNSNWKALGRTLLLDESVLVAIEQSHKPSGNRECYYQVLLAWKENYPKKCTFGNLYQALVKEGMVGVARKMINYFDPL